MEMLLIISTHIESDVVNNQPTLVYTDDRGEEWIHENQPLTHGGYLTKLVKKKDSWYFNPENKN